MKTLGIQNNEINHEIDRCRHDLHKYNNKLQMLDNMTHLATQSLEVYFQAVRYIISREKKMHFCSFFLLAYGKFRCICY